MHLNAFIRWTIALAVLSGSIAPLVAQDAAPQATAAQASKPDGSTPSYIRPETPEQRKARLGTTEDPGLEPDSTKQWWRHGHTYTIEKYERKWAAYDQPAGWVRPMAMVNFAAEIYQQNDTHVWAWMPVFEKRQEEDPPMAPKSRFDDTHIAYFHRVRTQFSELIPPAVNRVVRFKESSAGLPDSGSWRNSLAVADMNKDGKLDLIAPPERGARNLMPSIFLGDGKGGWKYWESVIWPRPLDYGSVAAADFNKDGNQDLAFAVHLDGVHVFLGNGKGSFVDASEGLPRDFPTRRLTTADVDLDGDVDLVVSSEGPTVIQNATAPVGKVRVFLNESKAKSWRGVDVVDPSVKIGGDWVTTANLNGDKYPDIITSSVYFGGMEMVHLSKGAAKWEHVASDGDLIPSLSYYFASTAGKFSSKKQDDAILTSVRFWPGDLDPNVVPLPPLTEVTNIDRVVVSKDGAKRIPIARYATGQGISGIASGDVDGDGELDLLYLLNAPRAAGLLLGNGKGGFSTAVLEGLPLEDNKTYDVRLADVNGDKRLDVVIMYETASTTALAARDGAVKVFLNQGAGAAQTAPGK
ncbi:MAG: VCBS repeat-containing protein [Thermoanaerobaculia bacterium]